MLSLEIGNQIRAIKNAVSKIASQRGEPCAAQKSAEIAHRVLAAYASPVGEGGTGEQNRPWEVGADRAHDHDLPTRLAVPDQTGFHLRLRVTGRDLLDKSCLGMTDIGDRLTGDRFRQEAHEVAGVPRAKHDADLAIVLHAANAGSVTGPGIEDDERPLLGIDCDASRRNDSDQPIIDRTLESPTVEYQFALETLYMRRLSCVMVKIVVAALAQHIKEQHRTLPPVYPVFLSSLEGLHRENQITILHFDPLFRSSCHGLISFERWSGFFGQRCCPETVIDPV